MVYATCVTLTLSQLPIINSHRYWIRWLLFVGWTSVLGGDCFNNWGFASETDDQKVVCFRNIHERSRPKFKPQVCLDDNKASQSNVWFWSLWIKFELLVMDEHEHQKAGHKMSTAAGAIWILSLTPLFETSYYSCQLVRFEIISLEWRITKLYCISAHISADRLPKLSVNSCRFKYKLQLLKGRCLDLIKN